VRRRSFAGLATLAIALIAACPTASAQVPAACPSTFEVLHHDRIGALALDPGPYSVTVLDQDTLTCADAFELFRQFLEDYDGRLHGGWRLDAATATFTRGGTGVGFSVARTIDPPAPPSSRVCPSYFTVLHNDHIGSFAIRGGRYRIVLLSVGPVSCARASTYFARFLQDWDGVLPRPWSLDRATGSFMRGNRHVGFRIERFAGPVPAGGASGTHPADGRRCPGTFRVLHTDRIGRVTLRRGPYIITRLRAGSPSCARASKLFASFLQDFDGVLDEPWVLIAATGTFTRGRGSSAGFRVKPARAR
jgi:hypothetical protein